MLARGFCIARNVIGQRHEIRLKYCWYTFIFIQVYRGGKVNRSADVMLARGFGTVRNVIGQRHEIILKYCWYKSISVQVYRGGKVNRSERGNQQQPTSILIG